MADRAAGASIRMMVVRSGKQVIFTTDLPLFKPRTRVASASEHRALLLKKPSHGRAVRALSFPSVHDAFSFGDY